MKQKRKIFVAGILVLLIICGIYYLNADNQGKTENNEVWVCTKGTEGITSIAIHGGKDSRIVNLKKEEESWIGDNGDSYDYDDFVSYMATLGYMKVGKKLDLSDADEGAQYGIDDSSYTIRVSYDGGEEYEYILGKSVDGLGMYLSMDQGKSVCLIDVQRAKTLSEIVESFYDVALSHVKFGEIRGINLYSPEHGTISMNRSESPRAGGDFYWNIFEPFSWNADTEKVEALIEKVEKNKILKRIEQDVTLETSGLDVAEEELASISLYDTYDSEMSIYIGNTEGDYAYCKTNYMDDIYLINKEVLQVINTQVEDLLDLTLYYYEIPSIEKCTIDFEGEVHVLEAEWETAENSNKRGQRYYLDQEVLTGAQYRSVTAWFTDTKVKTVGDVPADKGAILGTITIERLSPPYQQIVTFYEIKGNPQLVQVEVDKTRTACIERQELENLKNLF